jgi:pimeloyl-ACP methyl ester carboxylesterase
MRTSDWVREEGYVCRTHRLDVPLDYARPDGGAIEVFARELRGSRDEDLPYLIYLQGGPGFEVGRPVTLSAWQKAAIKQFNLIFLDQRGTGMSTPFESALALEMSSVDLADYLVNFRADSIIKDAEAFRRHLLGRSQRWSVLGQSFGGFCALSYLSFAPEGLERVMLTGGVPPIGQSAVKVYEALTPNVHQRTRAMYEKFPEAVGVISALRDELTVHDYRLPNGDRFHVERLRSLGIMLGRSCGGSSLYGLLEMSKARGADGRLTSRFLHAVERAASVATNPIYAILHEAIYCEGSASNWAAHQVKSRLMPTASEEMPVCFDGEMIFPWMFTDLGALASLQGAAEILATKSDWSPLYDTGRLQGNTVPTVALVYDEDMYVDRELSLATMNTVGTSRVWSTNEYEHDGLRQDGGRIFKRLLEMSKDLSR